MMKRKEFIELAIKAADVFGRLHGEHIMDAEETLDALAEAIVGALNEGYGDAEVIIE